MGLFDRRKQTPSRPDALSVHIVEQHLIPFLVSQDMPRDGNATPIYHYIDLMLDGRCIGTGQQLTDGRWRLTWGDKTVSDTLSRCVAVCVLEKTERMSRATSVTVEIALRGQHSPIATASLSLSGKWVWVMPERHSIEDGLKKYLTP